MIISAHSKGANDVANAFATSVGSGALSLRSAILIAAVMEFFGAFLLGGNVATTITKNITNAELYSDKPEVLMLGMMCVVLGVAMWLILATIYSLPVSTTHSCIGGMVGMAVVSLGWNAVKWVEVLKVVISWVVTPVLSGLISTLVFWVVRKFILRSKEPLKRSFQSYPIIVAVTIALNLFLVLYKSESLNIQLPAWVTGLICIAVGLVIGIILQFTFIPYVKRKINKEKEKESTELAVKETQVEVEMVSTKESIPVQVEVEKSEKADVKDSIAEHLKEHQNIHAELEDEKSKVYQMHKNAEVFDPSTEKMFTYLQIITAVFNSFAHGANDVANAIGPFAACVAIYQTGNASGDATVNSATLVLGGVGIVVGLACLGYKVMAAIGVNMVKVTPSRGFSIEIGSALVIIFGSTLGLPLSTTHCKVGSTVGVGLVEGKNGVNWSLLYGVFAGWIITLFVCAISTGLIFAFAIYSPKI